MLLKLIRFICAIIATPLVPVLILIYLYCLIVKGKTTGDLMFGAAILLYAWVLYLTFRRLL